MNVSVGRVVQRTLALLFVLAAGGCPKPAPPPQAPAPKPPTFTASRIRSFSDSLTVTAIADSPAALLVGTPRGLLRWEGTRSSLLSSKEGLPADRVAAIAVDPQGGTLVATAKGLSRGYKNGWTNWAMAPVGSFLTGLVSDGKTVWAGGPEGLGRLRAGKWEHYFADTGVTALAAGYGGTVWVGTVGRGRRCASCAAATRSSTTAPRRAARPTWCAAWSPSTRRSSSSARGRTARAPPTTTASASTRTS